MIRYRWPSPCCLADTCASAWLGTVKPGSPCRRVLHQHTLRAFESASWQRALSDTRGRRKAVDRCSLCYSATASTSFRRLHTTRLPSPCCCVLVCERPVSAECFHPCYELTEGYGRARVHCFALYSVSWSPLSCRSICRSKKAHLCASICLVTEIVKTI